MDKKFSLILIIIVGAMIGLVLFTNNGSENTDQINLADAKTVTADDHVRGAKQADVVLIEYADYACPGCAAVYPVLFQVERDFADQLTFVFRNFPISSLHPNTLAAHRAAEAAALQDKFWDMYDLLFARHDSWAAATSGTTPQQAIKIFESYAQEIGLDMDKYRTDAAGQEVSSRIAQDMDSGTALGINSTPTLLLNGERIRIPQTVDELKQLIQDAIDTASPTTTQESQ